MTFLPAQPSCLLSRLEAISARRALIRTLGLRDYELFSGCLAFIRTAHYWTMLHPEIESEEDMLELMRGHEELARLLLEDPGGGSFRNERASFAELTRSAGAQ